MPYSYKIHKCPNISVAEILIEKSKGTTVTLTSHPGNASLYKLSLWGSGIPETLWDVTCVKADKNNQPAYLLRGGEKTLLISNELFEEVECKTSTNRRYVTAYQYTKYGERLGRVHVRAMEKYFGDFEAETKRHLSSQSRLLLTQKEKVQTILEYLAWKDPKSHFPRCIDKNGVMIPYFPREGFSAEKIANSCIEVFAELEHLLFSEDEIVTSGGVVHGFPLVPVIASLCGYWASGSVTRYDVSGPDMIHYATTTKYQESLSLLLNDLHRNFPALVPKKFDVYMPNGVIFRTGNRMTDQSGADDRLDVLCDQILNQQQIRRGKSEGERLSDVEYEVIKDAARRLHHIKPFNINSAVDCYHSQHDDGIVIVPQMFVNMPLSQIEERALRLKSILRI